MSEEIIIDGVNVTECEFLRHCVIPDNEGCKIDDSLCCDVGNCYYKQLKRLQAENEELKALCDTYFTCYKAKHNDIEGNLFSYRKALEEIREILNNMPTINDFKETETFLRIQDKINEVLK